MFSNEYAGCDIVYIVNPPFCMYINLFLFVIFICVT